jgi:CheY-like chemotaxis protein
VAAPVILSAEDSDADFSIMEAALRECLYPLDLRRVSDGEQAIIFLQRPTGEPLPALVILDVNLPRLNGFEVLQFMKSQESTRHIPVVMFTSSARVRDKNRALTMGAQEYLTKPMSLDRMLELLNEVCVKYIQGPKAAHA